MDKGADVADVFTSFVDEVRGRLEGLETCIGILMAHVALADPAQSDEMTRALEGAAEDVRRSNGHPQKRDLLMSLAQDLRQGPNRKA